ILNASASSKQPLSAAARASARIPGGQPRDGGVGIAHRKPQPHGRKRLGSQYRGAPSGKCDGSTGNHYTKKYDIFVRMGNRHRLSVDEWQIGNTQHNHPGGEAEVLSPTEWCDRRAPSYAKSSISQIR